MDKNIIMILCDWSVFGNLGISIIKTCLEMYYLAWSTQATYVATVVPHRLWKYEWINWWIYKRCDSYI